MTALVVLSALVGVLAVAVAILAGYLVEARTQLHQARVDRCTNKYTPDISRREVF